MNIHEAARSGKPFFHKDMIGAYLIVDGYLVHRDCFSDFNDMKWIRENAIPNRKELYFMETSDLLRTDWEIQS